MWMWHRRVRKQVKSLFDVIDDDAVYTDVPMFPSLFPTRTGFSRLLRRVTP